LAGVIVPTFFGADRFWIVEVAGIDGVRGGLTREFWAVFEKLFWILLIQKQKP
jgi:hypothetical protein